MSTSDHLPSQEVTGTKALIDLKAAYAAGRQLDHRSPWDQVRT